MALQRIICGNGAGGALVHTCNPCDRELGRVRGVVLVDGSVDLTAFVAAAKADADGAAATKLEELIEGGKAHLISETTGTFDGGAAQTGDGYGDEETRLLGYLYTLTFKDPSYASNVEFYEKAEAEHWKIIFRTETLLHIVDVPSSIQAVAAIEQDLTSAVAWNVTATWKSKKKVAVVPIGSTAKFFEGCWSVSAE